MLMQGVFDLNSVQMYTESHKEALKKTMLNQEVIFRNQVEELHRLYTIQKTLMENLAWGEFDRYTSRKARTQSSLLPRAHSAIYEPLAKEVVYSSISTVGPTQSTSHMSIGGHRGIYYKLWQGPQDLHLPADQNFCYVDPELKLSLSTGEDSRRKGSSKRTWSDNEAGPCAQIIINLEDSSERVSNEGERDGPFFKCAALKTHSGGKHEPEFSVRINKHLPDVIAASHSVLGDGKCCKNQNSLSKGFKDCDIPIPRRNLSTMMQQPTSFKATLVDLNKVQVDDSSCCSNDFLVAHPSTASSANVFVELVGRVHKHTCASIENKNCSKETSKMLQQDEAVDSSLADSNCKGKITEIWARNSKFHGAGGSEAAGVEAVSRIPLGLCEDHGGHRSDHNKCTVNLGVTSEHTNDLLDNPNLTLVATRQKHFEKNAVEDVMLSSSGQRQNSTQDGRGTTSPASCKSCGNIDNDSGSVKTVQSGIEMGSSNLSAFDQFSGTGIGCQVAETLSGNQGQGSSDGSESKHDCLNNKQESSEADVSIQRAAESLLQFSLEMTSGTQGCSPKKAALAEMKNEVREQPQYSSDSFELIALNLEECTADDYSVSWKPFEVNDAETKDLAFKLRRGRRMKDFQKEILPDLASLSRHEIREDINILEGVLRSREYRKIRARMADKQSWCAPVRSRRSALNHVRRRQYER